MTKHANEYTMVNAAYWMEHELRKSPRVALDLAALAAKAERIVLAGGRDSQDQMTYQPNKVLASTLVQFSDLVAGWQMLARPHSEQEQASVAHRRGICAELTAIAARLTSEPEQLAGAVKAWQAWQDACQRSASPRLAVMGKQG
jgi:hypothetical protein